LNIIVGICTYNRPEYLKHCLASLLALKTPDEVTLTIVVVDNSPEQSVQAVVETAGAVYVREANRGLVFARNALLNYVLLDHALSSSSGDQEVDYIGFIDDDEVVEPDWLINMLVAISETKADAVSGPIEIVLPADAPGYLKYAYQFSEIKAYRQAKTLPMGNVFFHTKLVKGGLRFDPKFNFIGGEDVDFFRRAGESGRVLYRCPQGKIYEYLTPDKASLSAFFRRVLRVSRVHYSQKYPSYSIKYGLEVCISLLEIMLCVLFAPIFIVSGKIKVKQTKMLGKALGRILSRKPLSGRYYGN